MKKDDVRSTPAYRQMVQNVFGEHQAVWMSQPNRDSLTAAEARQELRDIHDETLARIGKYVAPSPKSAVQKPLVPGRKPTAKRTTGSKPKK